MRVSMPALAVDREAVRTLVIAVGVREAARRMSIPEGTVQAWSAKGKWIQHHNALAATRPRQPITTSPSEALSATLAERKDKSALHLSKYVVQASQKAAKSAGDLKIAKDVRQVSAIRAELWHEKQASASQTLININLV